MGHLEKRREGPASHPDTPEAWFNCGVSYIGAGDYPAAEECFSRAVALAPYSRESMLNLGYVLGEQGRSREALRCYESILAAFPACAEARYNRAAHLLRAGDFRAGFADYEARFAAMKSVDQRVYSQPRWDGSPLRGRSILVYCEQGLGDALQFSRYLPLLAEQGARVLLEVQRPLVSLLASIEGVGKVVAKSDTPPSTDFHIPLLTLPHIFGTTLETIPASVPYIIPPETLVAAWRTQTGAESGILRVGLAWAGKELPYPNRSLPPEYLAPLLAVNGTRFYSLQIGERDRLPLPPELAEQVIDLTGGIEDFADTAALIANLDLVITIDTAVAHLAGALGKPVWVLLPAVADWRWLDGRDDSPWYPSMRLFRQGRSGDWPSVVVVAVRGLREWLTDGTDAANLPGEAFENMFQTAMENLDHKAFDAAISQFKKLLKLLPDEPAVWFNLGRAYLHNGNNTDAEQCFRQVILLKSESPDALLRLGRLCRERKDFGEAEKYLRKAHELVPESVDILFELGATLIPQGKRTEAFDCCQKILAMQPDCVEAVSNLAHLQLSKGDYLSGFANFEARLVVSKTTIDPRHYPQPRWDGSPLGGKSILVYGEQGMGDVIQFSRYIPLIAELGGKVVFEVEKQLVSLFDSFPGVAEVVQKSPTPPLADVYIQSSSLPHLFRTTLETIPNRVPYIVAAPSKVAAWRRMLAHDAAFRVGLVWRGSPLNPLDQDRSASLAAYSPFAHLADVSFYSLQVGPASEEATTPPEGMKLTDLTGMLEDFSDTAALIANLDLVISVDTGVAHLAGALGKPVWVLLPNQAEWRWLEERNDSPWYPTMRLFRQPLPGDWPAVVDVVVRELRDWVTDKNTPTDTSGELVESIFRTAMSHFEQKAYDAAICQFRKLLMLRPDEPAAWFNLGRAYLYKENDADAEQCFRQVLRLEPDSPDAWLRLGCLCRKRRDFGEAEACLRRAHELVPDSVDILLELTASLTPQGKRAEAFDCCREILALQPNCMEAVSNLAWLQLCSGDYLHGFANFEARFSIAKFQIDPRCYLQARWDGSPLEGKSILVYGEQGLGDVIMFSRYLPLIAQYGGKMILEVDKLLVSLFTSFSGVAQVVQKSATPPLADVYIQSSSLPHIFRTTLDTIPNRVPYLTADPSKVAAWQRMLAGDSSIRVGLVWRGNPLNPLDQDRSAPLTAFSPLADLDGVSFYSLQVGPAAEETTLQQAGMRLTDVVDKLEDFADTAALIANLDLVISVDTGVAHLAGALGKPVWVLLSFVPCWRYMLNRDDSPWYPTMRLFRQERPGEWGGVIARVRDALESFVSERAN